MSRCDAALNMGHNGAISYQNNEHSLFIQKLYLHETQTILQQHTTALYFRDTRYVLYLKHFGE